MNGMIRLTAAVNKVKAADPGACCGEIKRILAGLPGRGCDIVAFPRLALCSPSCGSLLLGDDLPALCSDALDELTEATADTEGYVIVGLPVDDLGRTASVMAVLYRGELVALVPTLDNPAPFVNETYSENIVPADTVFSCGRLRFCVMGCDLSTLALRAMDAAATGCDLLILPAYSPVYAGLADEVCETARVISRSTGCAVAVVNGGAGDTSSPYVYGGFAAICECGELMARVDAGDESVTCTADLDVDIIRARKRVDAARNPSHSIRPALDKPGLLRALRQNPWLPAENPGAYLDDLFRLQARSLAGRMRNTGICKPVLGVSGGLDSTAALLVCAAACDLLDLPRGNILGVTMPGFGTSGRTHRNARELMEQIGVTGREIPIRDAVTGHLKDIGHTGEQDTTYENAQARERAQILFDLANREGGLVVGTGDLSEAALGFCTFAGDQIAGYNVNICIPKTLLRELVSHVAETGLVRGVAEVVRDILDTPVSPELLPPAEGGEIGQKTEDILGPYLLHDFFLYYFVRYRLRPAKLYAYACAAFRDGPEPAFIREKLGLFFRRLCAGQFKRACAPDAASVTEVNLNGVNFYIPSDLDASSLLREIEDL